MLNAQLLKARIKIGLRVSSSAALSRLAARRCSVRLPLRAVRGRGSGAKP